MHTENVLLDQLNKMGKVIKPINFRIKSKNESAAKLLFESDAKRIEIFQKKIRGANCFHFVCKTLQKLTISFVRYRLRIKGVKLLSRNFSNQISRPYFSQRFPCV